MTELHPQAVGPLFYTGMMLFLLLVWLITAVLNRGIDVDTKAIEAICAAVIIVVMWVVMAYMVSRGDD